MLFHGKGNVTEDGIFSLEDGGLCHGQDRERTEIHGFRVLVFEVSRMGGI